METVGSHGVVVVLLLVVVAAALFTGRNSDERDGDPSMAEHSDLLDFDEGNQIDLPLPLHGSAPAGLAASVDTGFPSPEQHHTPSTTASTNSGTELPTSADSKARSRDLAVKSPPEYSVMNPIESGRTSAKTPVTLDSPDAKSFAATASEPDIARVESNLVRANEFVIGSTVDMRTASSRIATESSDSTLPTLEILADANPNADATSTEPGQTNVLSSTPSRIKNLLQYLPSDTALPTGTATAGAATPQ